MKTLAALICFVLFHSALLAHAQLHPMPNHSMMMGDVPAVHGMLMVGSGKIYLSHLPMFHAPHDYQVLLEVAVSGEALKVYQEQLKASAEEVYTLVPEPFVLPDMIQHPHPFKAQIFQGHFERGGKVIASQVEVKILKVLFFKKFDPAAQLPLFSNDILFGSNEEPFLAHVITAKPDFDQVVKLEPLTNVFPNSDSSALGVVIRALPNTSPIQGTQPLTGFHAKSQRQVILNPLSQIYFETSDLAH